MNTARQSTAAPSDRRARSLAMIHVAKKQLKLDDGTYRDILERTTGKRSAGDMSEPERDAVVAALRDLGFKPASRTRKRGLGGPYAAKLQALWIAGWNLGVVRDRRDKALVAFVERQTGLSHTRFLRFPEGAAKAIEGLKGWLAREAHVDWSAPGPGAPSIMGDDRFRIVAAQLRRLGLDYADCQPIVGKGLGTYDSADWRTVMNALGERVRGLGR